MISFLRRLSAVTPRPSALVIQRSVIALGGGVCAAVGALLLGQAAQPRLHPLVAVADTRPTIIDGPPTNVEPAPPPVAPRLRRPRADPEDDGDAYEDASVAAPDQTASPQAPQTSQGPWQGPAQGQVQAEAQVQDQAPRTTAQARAAWPSRCAGYASTADRMVCAFPRLNAAEVALQRVYGMALYQTDDPDALREQQRRWRAVRDQVAEEDGPEALAELYAERIQELNGGGYY